MRVGSTLQLTPTVHNFRAEPAKPLAHRQPSAVLLYPFRAVESRQSQLGGDQMSFRPSRVLPMGHVAGVGLPTYKGALHEISHEEPALTDLHFETLYLHLSASVVKFKGAQGSSMEQPEKKALRPHWTPSWRHVLLTVPAYPDAQRQPLNDFV